MLKQNSKTRQVPLASASPRSKATIYKGSVHIHDKTPKYNKKGNKRKNVVRDVYMITISNRNKKKYLTKEDILGPLMALVTHSACVIHHYAYELGDKYQQLHMHAIIVVSSKFRYKSLVNHSNGMYIKFDRLRPSDLSKSIGYVNKQNTPIEQERILQANYFNNNYAFQEKKGVVSS